MSGLRSPCLAAFALLCLASAARADMAGPWPWSRATKHPWGHGAPPPGWFEREKQMREREPSNGETETSSAEDAEQKATPLPPPRTGPFRSCGSGSALGLAGIGVAWGLMWAGNRYAGRVAKLRTAVRRPGEST